MMTGLGAQVDFIEELRLRRWARENFVPVSQRDRGWHPIVLEEMSRKDHDVRSTESVRGFASPDRH